MKFLKMKKPLKYEVKDGNKIVLRPGAKNISIAFRASPRWYIDHVTGQRMHFNVYGKPNGELVHGY